MVARTRVQQAARGGVGGGDVGGLDDLLDLIDMHPGLDMTTPLMQSFTKS